MPRSCSVCVHNSRIAIERAIVQGEAIRRLASQHGVHEAALARWNERSAPFERQATPQERARRDAARKKRAGKRTA